MGNPLKSRKKDRPAKCHGCKVEHDPRDLPLGWETRLIEARKTTRWRHFCANCIHACA